MDEVTQRRGAVSHEVSRYHGAAMPEVLPARRNGEMGDIWHGWVRELMLRSAIHEPWSQRCESTAAVLVLGTCVRGPASAQQPGLSIEVQVPTSGTAWPGLASPLCRPHTDKGTSADRHTFTAQAGFVAHISLLHHALQGSWLNLARWN